MAKSRFTQVLYVLGLIFSTFLLKAQQVTFSISPSTISPNIGDTISLRVVVANFTDIVSFQYALEYDPALFGFVSLDSLNIPDQPEFGSNAFGGNSVLVGWSSSGGRARSVPNEQAIFRLRFRVLAASTNYWLKFSNVHGTTMEVRRFPGTDLVRLNQVTFNHLGMPPGSGPSPVSVIATATQTVAPNAKVCVDVTTNNFTNLVSASWNTTWNAAVLRFDSISFVNSTAAITQASFNTTTASTGSIALNWAPPVGTGARTVANGAVLYRVCFTAIGAAGTSSQVNFTNGTIQQAGTPNPVSVTMAPTAGTVNIVAAQTGGILFTASNHTVDPGANVCIKIRVAGFTDVAAVEFYPHWDSTKLQFVRANISIPAITTDTLFAGESSSQNVTMRNDPSGTLRFVWFSPTGLGVTLPDSTQLLEICFRYIGGAGTSGAVFFADYPRVNKFTSGTTFLPIRPLNYRAGRVTATGTTTAPITLSASIKNVTCFAGSDGGVTLTVGGGIGTFIYNWSNGRTTKDISGVAPGTYRVTITSGTVNKVDSFIVAQPNDIFITPNITNSGCTGGSNGAINITATGGTNPLSYSWTGPNNFTSTSQNISALVAGDYALIVRYAGTCSKNFSYTVNTGADITVTPTVRDAKCNGGSDGSINLAITGGSNLTFSWRGPGGFTKTTQNIDSLKAGAYTVTISNGVAGCDKTNSYTIQEPQAISIAPSVTNVKCKGGTDGVITLGATGGTGVLTYRWTGSSSTAASATGLKVGAYSATVTDANGCTATRNFNITEPTDSLKIQSADITKAACASVATGAVAITPTGGTAPYTFRWVGPGTFNSTQQNISTLLPGTYNLTVTDAALCTFTAAYVVEANTTITITPAVFDAENVPNGRINITVTGGTTPYDFNWSGQGVAPTNQNQTGLCPGQYAVTVMDANRCSATREIRLGGSCSTPIALVVNITPAGCPGQQGGKIELTASGGAGNYTYVWTNAAGGIVSASRIADGLVAGIYKVVVTDQIGQSRTETYEIRGSQTTVRFASIGINAESCIGNDGSIVVAVTEGAPPYSFRWRHLQGDNQPQDLRNIAAGTYGVTVRDNNGCLRDTNMLVVPRNPCPLVASTTRRASRCFGQATGSITVNILNGEPGYVIKWSATDSARINNAPRRDATREITNLAAGTYTITITDARGQVTTVTETVEGPTQLTISRTVTPVRGNCDGAIVLAVSGGTGPYNYTWNTGATSRDIFGICCDSSKQYSVIVRDNNGCEVSSGNEIVGCQIAELTADMQTDNPNCRLDSLSGRITVTPRGGQPTYNYEWSNAQGLPVGSNSPILSNVPPGIYRVTITDGRQPNPRRWQSQSELRVRSNLALANLSIECADDNDGKASIDILGGVAPFVARWSNGMSSVVDATNRKATETRLPIGNAYVVITDAQGCLERRDFVMCSKSCAAIEILTRFNDTLNLKCFGDQNGSARVTRLSTELAQPIRSYKWSSDETAPTAYKLKSGINTVTITDANGKACQAIVILKEPSKLNVKIKVDDKEKSAQAIVSGGVPPYAYRWTPNEDRQAKIGNLVSGKIYLYVSDNNNCLETSSSDVRIGVECLTGSPIITPNDDSRNEGFKFKSCDLKGITLEIYNRWGQLVYTNPNYTEGVWQGNDQDGTSGRQLPEGGYLYILKAKDPLTGQEVIGRGTVNILRQ
jgi:gliding motility-associated-like protein